MAVKGGATDCPYSYMRDMVAGKYALPWEDQVLVTDGTPCGFEPPTRLYKGEEANPIAACSKGHCTTA